MAELSMQVDSNVAIVRFENGPKGLMRHATVQELKVVADQVSRRDDIHVVIFTGSMPGVFIRHYDVAELARDGEALAALKLDASRGQVFPEREIDSAFLAVENLPQVTVAAINGHCMGGGMEFALSCDVRVAERGDFRLGLPEALGGIFPGAGGTQRLPRAVGVSTALDMILRGRLLTPEEALRVGLVHDLEDDALDHARAIARRIANRPGGQAGTRMAKQLVRGALTWSLHEGLARERTLVSDLLGRPEVFAHLSEAAKADLDITRL